MLSKCHLKLFLCLFFLYECTLSFAFAVNTETHEIGPYQLIEKTSSDVLQLLKTGIDPVTEADKFVEELSAILDPVVAFDSISTGVMGVYAKKASPEQRRRFSATLKQSVLQTYGKGMFSFQVLDITVLPPKQPLDGKRRATVMQKIYGSSGAINIAYFMGKNRKNQWKMLNFVFNGVNFGQVFRGQFAAAVNKNGGDLDKTIAQWTENVQI